MVYSVLKGLLVPSNINSKEFHLTIVQLYPVKTGEGRNEYQFVIRYICFLNSLITAKP